MHFVVCNPCGGTGTCPACAGRGTREFVGSSLAMLHVLRCPTCEGDGACGACWEGLGTVSTRDLPAAVRAWMTRDAAHPVRARRAMLRRPSGGIQG
jgi:hypothetical protein